MAGEACSGFCEKAGKAFAGLLEPLGYELCQVREVEVEPEGPRLIIGLEGEGYEAYIDFSPDGCEHTVILRAAKDLDEEAVEERISEIIETWEEFSGIEEYDVSYSPSDGYLIVVLLTTTLSEQPPVGLILRAVKEALGTLQHEE